MRLSSPQSEMLRAAAQGKLVVAPDTPQHLTARALERKGAATLVDDVVTLTPAGTAEAERRALPKALVNVTPPQLKAFAEVVRRAVAQERPAWIGVDLYEPTVEALVRRGLVLIQHGGDELGGGVYQVLLTQKGASAARLRTQRQDTEPLDAPITTEETPT